MYSHAPRIALSYDEFAIVVPIWAALCERMAVFQHDPDSGCSRTHIHILIEGCSVKAEALRRALYKHLPGETRKGNDLWAWEHKKWAKAHPGQQYNDNMLTYMSKGTTAPSFIKNYSPELVEQRKQQWNLTTPKPGAPKDEKYNEWEHICRNYDLEHGTDTLTLDETRKWTFSWYWRRDGRAPLVPNYKRNAVSLFIRANEKKGDENFRSAVSEVFNLWY